MPMRRLHDRRPATLFRGAELPRLMTMIVMLGVIIMLMTRFKDPATLRALVGAAGDEDSSTIRAEDLQASKPSPAAARPTEEPKGEKPAVDVPAPEPTGPGAGPVEEPKVETPPEEPPAGDVSPPEAPTSEVPPLDVPAADVPPPEPMRDETVPDKVSADAADV